MRSTLGAILKVIAIACAVICILGIAVIFGLAVGEADRRDHQRNEAPHIERDLELRRIR